MGTVDIESAVLSEVNGLDQTDTIDHIKNVVCEKVSGLDPTVSIKKTRFFNHSFAPDMVLHWDDSSRQERYVYLRTTKNKEILRDDVVSLSEYRPLLVTVSGNTTGKETESVIQNDERADLENTAIHSDTLVSSLNTVGSIERLSKKEPVNGIYSKLLVRGGEEGISTLLE